MAAAMILGVAGTSFAASNPFVDVPANNWAYDSVKMLAKAGIVDGYGDGTFKGDKTITRYEMAQIVAKAMGNEEKANAQQKAEIKKLQAEFSDELDKLGVRVGNLEKNQPNLKFNGTFGLRYHSQDNEGIADTTAFKYRLRLDAKAVVDENTTFGMRIANNSYNKKLSAYGLPAGSQWSTFGSDKLGDNNGTGTDNATIDRAFLTRQMGTVTATAGRQSLVVGTTQAIVDNGNINFDGIKLATKIGAVNATVNHGRLVSQIDVDSVELSTKTGKFAYGGGYFAVRDNAPTSTNTAIGPDVLKLKYLNAAYTFNSKFSLTAEGGQNDANYATHDDKFYTVLAKYGAQSLKKDGDQNFVVQYYSVGANSLGIDTPNGSGLTTLDAAKNVATKFTGWDYSYNRALSKNLTTEFHYVKIDNKDTQKDDYNYYRVNVTAKF
ncbi:S-layer homology domain-containing protein [Pelosinus sp. IPA-1]|uniref:S-layer homology domain-containing protein n=1 Tax=Pelosinus sp. IPA-1 TaxID=3029569 RepID=UPI00255771C7|nr:S-layer homology domain-containing protein [Pelosinus sp. IPA-1]